MKKNRVALPCALLSALPLALAACGGGGGTAAVPQSAHSVSTAATTTTAPNTTSTSTPSTATPSDQTAPAPVTTTPESAAPIVVEYYGDSTVWGYRTHTGGQVDKPAPTAFAEALPDPVRYEVRNEGVSATTACDLLNGSDGRHPAWQVQMANSKAQYVLVNHAINDQWRYDVATYKSCLAGLATGARQHGKTMIFETPNPTRDSGSGGLDVYVNAMKEVAAQQSVAVIDQYGYLTDYLGGQSPYTICPDGLHPTQEVYVLKGQYAAEAFSRLFN